MTEFADTDSFVELDELMNDDEVVKKDKSIRGLLAVLAVTAGAMHPAIITDAHQAYESVFGKQDCQAYGEINQTQSLGDIRETVAHMTFGLTLEKYLTEEAKLASATDIPAVEATLNDVFKPFDISVFINKQEGAIMPGLFGSDMLAEQHDHQQADVTLEHAKKSATSLMLALSQIPASFLHAAHDSRIYLFSSLSHAEIAVRKGWTVDGDFQTSSSPYDHDVIELLADGQDDSGSTYKHELNHLLQQRQCGAIDGADVSSAITSANPRGFRYSALNGHIQDAAYNNHDTVTQYADTDPGEDRAETGRALLSGQLTDAYRVSHPVIYQKMIDVAAQQTGLEPGILSLYRYLGYTNDQPFPGEIAQRTIALNRTSAPVRVQLGTGIECSGLLGSNGQPVAIGRAKLYGKRAMTYTIQKDTKTMTAEAGITADARDDVPDNLYKNAALQLPGARRSKTYGLNNLPITSNQKTSCIVIQH